MNIPYKLLTLDVLKDDRSNDVNEVLLENKYLMFFTFLVSILEKFIDVNDKQLLNIPCISETFKKSK